MSGGKKQKQNQKQNTNMSSNKWDPEKQMSQQSAIQVIKTEIISFLIHGA